MENTFKYLFTEDCRKLLAFITEDDIRELRLYKDNLPTSEEALQIAVELYESEN
jgi:hypothetical protein